MKTYFHFRTVGIQRKRINILIFTAVLCAEICIASFFVLIFNFLTARNPDVILRMIVIICTVILAGMGICFGIWELFQKKIMRGARYTYLDIQEKALVLSLYGGEYRGVHGKVIVRDLYYVPFEGLKGIEEEKNGKGVVLTGKIRHYGMNSDFLGYHIKDGDVLFDRQWLNIGGFGQVNSVKIPLVFGKNDRVYKAIVESYKKYLETPKKAPYVFKEADFIRRRAKPRVMPEDFGYRRDWSKRDV